MTTKLSKLKKNDLFKFTGMKKVYIFNGGKKVFKYTDYYDISGFKQTKTDRSVNKLN